MIRVVDGKTYAVKKIELETENKSFKKIYKDFESVINEIRCMTKIQNDNVVKYYQSWIESEIKEQRNTQISKIPVRKREKLFDNNKNYTNFDKISKKEKTIINELVKEKEKCKIKEIQRLPEIEDAKTSKTGLDLTLEYSSSNGDFSGILFENVDNSQNSLDTYKADKTINSFNSYDSEDSYSNLKRTSRIYSINNSENIYLKVNDATYDIKNLKNLSVYIQMELCKETLGDYMAMTQKDLTDEKIWKLLNMFLDVIKAVNHLHKKEKIIHRDIKPNNIFLSHENCIKLGDLGLATEIFDVKYKRFSFCESDYDTSSSRKNSDNSTNSNSQYFEFLSSKHTQISYHTKNVGTLQYASPEQLNNNFYDNKSDIYSLGLILFEMLHPFKTGMEKHKIFSDLKKKGRVPESFASKYQDITGVIKKMLDNNPNNRPEIEDILNIINRHLSKM